jgi:formamidopyrimidine-DNA glycosylase
MPELPEVETTKRGLAPKLSGQVIQSLQVYERQLRYPLPETMADIVQGQCISTVWRRAKYLVMTLDDGALLIHLGMSGSLRLTHVTQPLRRHDHVVLNLQQGLQLRFHDPRRFGCFLWIPEPVTDHPLLRNLGPEPFSDTFTGDYLWQHTKKRRAAIKVILMDSHIVVGIGNIYANEALHDAKIHPCCPANRLSLVHVERLVAASRDVLHMALQRGGTTLRDFVREDGRPGYFAQELKVYGRQGQCCPTCGLAQIACQQIAKRRSFFCPHCQHCPD